LSVKEELIQNTNFKLKKQHLLIVGILILSFSISFLIRYQPAEFGFELNEFDPFFNYRATDFIIQNGIDEYFNWHDEKSWFPNGRDVSRNSQVMLHLTTAFSYSLFGFGMNLYDFAILFPAIIGSLTVVIIFALVRQIAGTTAGLFSALFFSVSLPIIVRGSIGWFKPEPLGLFYGLLGAYLLLSALNSKNTKISIAKIIGSGIILSLSLSAWGGSQFFVIPIGLFILGLPFFRKDHNFLLFLIPIFTITVMISSSFFERLGDDFAIGLGGLTLIVPTIFLVACIFLQKKSPENKKLRNGLLLLLGLIVVSSFLFVVLYENNAVVLPSYRYLNALNPFLTTTDPLVDSVAEHATTSIETSYTFHSIFMIFAGIGVWLIIKNKDKLETYSIKPAMASFALFFGMAGVYASATFVRLEVFASLSVVILSSIGLSILSMHFIKSNNNTKSSRLLKISFVTVIVVLFSIPLVYPTQNWVSANEVPPTILNGGSQYRISSDDWLDAMDWIRNNTPQDAVIAAWWDYGYWITTLGERTTLADNATISTKKIENMAKAFTSTPDEGVKMFDEMGADYILVFVTGELLDTNSEEQYYVVQGGGDESKKQWIMRIAGEKLSKYLHPDGISGTDNFWQNTLLGQLFPFSPAVYANFEKNLQSEEYAPGFVPVYVKDIKYPADGDEHLRLAYASPSFFDEKPGPLIGVFIYEIVD